jgi:hypothetical protein
VQPPDAATDTDIPELAVGFTLNVSPNARGDVGCTNVIDCAALPVATVWATFDAGRKFAFPACDAVSTQLTDADVIVTS